ncbi:MAG: 3'(2'),5'-bisphosphate nucleotidase CysQ [Gammaproteobacteria bacterium]
MRPDQPFPAQQLESLLEPVIALAKQAGHEILAIYESEFAVQHKADDSPLTQADLAAHQTIIEGLRALTPEAAMISEEAGLPPFEERAAWRTYWLVDPLDGTKEFVKRSGEFTVNIALIVDHRPVLGVVHTPVLDLTYAGATGLGAFRQKNEQPRQPIRVRRLGDGPVTVVGSKSHGTEALRLYLEQIGDYRLRSMGSSLKFCLVAEGSADLYPRLGPTSEWDTAAAQAVVEAAGGQVTDLAMNPLRYNTGESLLNPHFFVFGDPDGHWERYLPEALR